jgi:hypothetical protein
MLTAAGKLRVVRTAHTVVWAFFASAILLIPVAAACGSFRAAWILIAIVALECVILVANRMRCPLTPVAALYTDERAANFDIYLPVWLARHNKTIFGTLYALSVMYVVVLWARR